MRDDIKYWVWLSSIPRIGPVKCKQLLEYFEDAKAIWDATENDFKRVPRLTRTSIQQLIDLKIKNNANIHLENIYKNNIKVISIKDNLYPEYLKNIYDPPVVLYVKGEYKKEDKTVAVVGSRRATQYGLDMARIISCELAKASITVVSGMARGVDSYAHNGALDAGGRTLAVQGCGLDIIYPYENKKLFENICNNGAVISEYLPGITPLPQNFPARNRIISGMSLGVVVVEANERSGSLITANMALEQGREVFAVPGNANSMNSKGTNCLIREGAKIVTSIEDILEELHVFYNKEANSNNFSGKSQTRFLEGLDSDERKIAEVLIIEPLHIDMIAKKCEYEMKLVNSLLVMMELKGIVEQLPGKVFRLRI